MRIIFLMLCLLSISYTTVASDPLNKAFVSDGNSDSTPNNEHYDESCTKEVDILKARRLNEAFPAHCRCEQHDNDSLKVQQCFMCHDSCKKHIENQVNACVNINNQKNNLCKDSCTGDSLDFNPDQPPFSTAVSRCTQEKKEELEGELLQSCRQTIRNIQSSPPRSGATLVCPGGSGCEEYCRRSADTAIQGQNRIPSCQSQQSQLPITTQEGFRECFGKLMRQLSDNLPQDSSRLSQGFAWENCDLEKACDQEMQIAFNDTRVTCETLRTQAVVCCEKPLECGDESSVKLFKSLDTFSVKGGVSDICRKADEHFSNIGEASRKMADQCRTSALSCVQICRQKIENINVLLRNICTFDLLKEGSYNPERHTCSGRLIDKYVLLYKQHLEPVSFQCEVAGKKSTEIAGVASAILTSALSSANCDREARAGRDSLGPNAVSETLDRAPETENLRAETVSSSSSSVWGGASKHGAISGSNNRGGGSRVSGDSSSALLGASGGGSADSNNKFGTSLNSKGGFSGYGSHGASSHTQGLGGGGVSGSNAHQSKGALGDLWSRMKGKAENKGKKGNTKAGDKTNSGKKDAQGLEEGFLQSQSQEAQGGKGLSWDKIKPDNLHKRVSSFGSIHDDIFKRISDRIFVMCSGDKIIDCKF